MKKLSVLVVMLGACLALAAPPKVKLDKIRSVEPVSGAEKIEAQKPTWCDGYQKNANVFGGIQGSIDREITDGNWSEDKVLKRIAETACDTEEDADWQKQIAAWRQEWVNRTGTSAAKNAESFKLRIKSQEWEKQSQAHCAALAPSEEASPKEKLLTLATAMVTGCKNNAVQLDTYGLEQLGWWLDEGVEIPSELVKTAFVYHCLRPLNGDDKMSGPTRKLRSFATCSMDGKSLSVERLDAELKERGFNEFARINAHEVHGRTRLVVKALEERFRQMAAKEPAYQAIAFDQPEKGWKAWEAAYAANKTVVDAARAWEEKFYGPSKKAMQGCGKELRKNLAAYVKSKKPKDAKEAMAVMQDPIGYRLITTTIACDAVEERYIEAIGQSFALGRAYAQRGPRVAAHLAAVGALAEVLSDREKFPVEPKAFADAAIPKADLDLLKLAYNRWANNGNVFQTNYKQGEVKSVKKSKDFVTVVFKSFTLKEPIWECVKTNRISRILPDGAVEYEENCKKKGMATNTYNEHPVQVPVEFAEGLKPGMFARFHEASYKCASHPCTPRYNAFPAEIYKDKKREAVVTYYGYETK